MGKVVEMRRRRESVDSVALSGPLIYAPALMFSGAKVPLQELAEEVKHQAVEGRKAMHDQPFVIIHGEDAIAFPMTGEAYLSHGILLMDYLHDLCFGGGTADEGNEFMLFYKNPDGEHCNPPAEDMFAVLYLSADRGATWVDANNVSIRRGDR